MGSGSPQRSQRSESAGAGTTPSPSEENVVGSVQSGECVLLLFECDGGLSDSAGNLVEGGAQRASIWGPDAHHGESVSVQPT